MMGAGMSQPKTLYEILDIPMDANSSDVESGYQRALDVFRDDSLASYALFSPEEAERARREIELAYAVLKRQESRVAYDMALQGAQDKGQATVTFTATFELGASGTVSVSDGSIAPVETPRPEKKSSPPVVLIAAPVEDVAQPVVATPVEPAHPVEPAPAAPPPELAVAPDPPPAVTAPGTETLPPLPPPAPPVETLPLVMPSSVPVSLSGIDLPVVAAPSLSQAPTAPPFPVVPPPPKVPEPPRFRRVRLDDDTTAVQVARATNPSGLPTAPVETTPAAGHPFPLPEEGEINGSVLQRLRESRGITLRQLSDTTKVSVHYLKALEANAFNELPGRVYLRGFLIQLGRAFRVNPEKLATRYAAFADRFRNPVG